jgi:hypothetical protein
MGCWVFVLVLCGVVRVSVSVRACRIIVCYNQVNQRGLGVGLG